MRWALLWAGVKTVTRMAVSVILFFQDFQGGSQNIVGIYGIHGMPILPIVLKTQVQTAGGPGGCSEVLGPVRHRPPALNRRWPMKSNKRTAHCGGHVHDAGIHTDHKGRAGQEFREFFQGDLSRPVIDGFLMFAEEADAFEFSDDRPAPR